MNFRITFLLLLLTFSFYSSQIYVPYRQGDKFGISDESGKLVVPAQFDKIAVGYNNDFTGIKSTPTLKKSYILKDRIILKDTDFAYFQNEGQFIKAVTIIDKESYKHSRGNPNYLSMNLYNLKGEQILDRSYNNIVVIDESETKGIALKETALLLLYSSENNYGLYQIDKNQKKIIKTFFENSKDVDTDYKNFPKSFSITYDENQTKKKLIIDFENGKIKSSKTEDLAYNNDYRDGYGRSGYSSYEATRMPGIEAAKKPVPENSEGKIIRVRASFEDKTPEELSFETTDASYDYAYIKKEKNKFGYFLTGENKYLIMPKYDKIMTADGHGVFASGFLVKNSENYQYLVFMNKTQEFITPESKMIPYFFRRDYGKKGFQLFKMFDKDYKFFCYADQNGKLYYSK
ncbi:hypothetical protein ASG31_18045 [Chryseobacterium sp. Leaf404]|uniref:hypothetical protein n=1 Tax=unclassified Chryseobacterium TaxID=2593645 RepID=UPI00070091B8|nr:MULTISPECIES: hypothetical protein [unclassified Chryseobacterium]KQT19280.1 hypothetical protein ASG31_18045 [Chryseobacterium sp. Leaf404]